MPDGEAKFGDVYWVNKDATEHPTRVGKPVRPMACMAERPNDTVWSGLPRITSDMKSGDQPSRAMPEVHPTRLGESGWWTARYIHPVHKRVTGVARVCEYLGELPTEELKVAKAVYRSRYD
ncbi:hypothetical protein ACHIPZ_23855 [Antrihabitans sp. NCIMB 15449]|jgi:hypothetical protein|uniref:Uncharacterized protein n=1 Tax=Antrihabitans spumae TaxID=3373370 RepID=A0ABW7JT85_9NOCA